jgi:hypothetical protein
LGGVSKLNRDPEPLPRCTYPEAADRQARGLQPLPDRLAPADFAAVRPYRSRRYKIVTLDRLASGLSLVMAREAARSFALRDPMGRHLVPPENMPPGLGRALHSDPFGSDRFGPWTTPNIFFWLIRLLVLTDPSSPMGAIRRNEETLGKSLAVLDSAGRVVGGAFNEIMPGGEELPGFRKKDPFLDAVVSHCRPILEFLGSHESSALAGLSKRYPAFRLALRSGRVGHHFMLTRSSDLPMEHCFEIVATATEVFRRAGCEFMGVEATDQWTGAACEALGGLRVHFQPYRARQLVQPSATPLPGVVSSSDGYISDKDSGSMFYLINLMDHDLTD